MIISMTLMYALIPFIFLLPAVVLFIIVLVYKKSAGIGSGASSRASGSAGNDTIANTDGGAEADVDFSGGNGADLDYDSGDQYDLYDSESALRDDFSEEITDGGDSNISETDSSHIDSAGEPEIKNDGLSDAERRYRHMMLAAVLVLVTGIVLMVGMYLGISVTPWSGWWPNWFAS